MFWINLGPLLPVVLVVALNLYSECYLFKGAAARRTSWYLFKEFRTHNEILFISSFFSFVYDRVDPCVVLQCAVHSFLKRYESGIKRRVKKMYVMNFLPSLRPWMLAAKRVAGPRAWWNWSTSLPAPHLIARFLFEKFLYCYTTCRRKPWAGEEPSSCTQDVEGSLTTSLSGKFRRLSNPGGPWGVKEKFFSLWGRRFPS